ncbi:hypothetical protein EB796_001344 [Bugula neritina]|uniref:Uncharacterized protein n=1 Tax=Bugula neritina TaxID=10212 RepID=A0A7J7KQ74_BUGNE|nr:hypothetical protein EB796_001344 [Bugula neritina]
MFQLYDSTSSDYHYLDRRPRERLETLMNNFDIYLLATEVSLVKSCDSNRASIKHTLLVDTVYDSTSSDCHYLDRRPTERLATLMNNFDIYLLATEVSLGKSCDNNRASNKHTLPSDTVCPRLV